jgi:hypothetical protein
VTQAMWNLVLVRLETMLVSMQDTRTIFAPNVLEARKSFWTHMMELLGGEAQVEACFDLFLDSANLDTR